MLYNKMNSAITRAMCGVALALTIGACSSAPEKSNASTNKSAPTIAIDKNTQREFDSAVSLMSASKLADAEPILKHITATTPTLPGAWVNLGIIYSRTDRTPQAKEVWERAISLQPSSSEPYVLLAQLNRQQGKFAEAERILQTALVRWPNDGDANFNLGILYDLYLDQPQKAIERYSRYQAKQKEPDKKVAAWIEQLKVKTKKKEP